VTAARALATRRRASILPRKAPKGGFELRDWQDKAVSEIAEALKSHKRVLLTAPTGAGKTEVYAAVGGKRVAKGGRVVVIAHTRGLVDQLQDRFLTRLQASLQRLLPKGVNVTVGTAGDPTTWNTTADGREIHVQVWTVQGITSAIRRGLEIPQASLVIFDEAHRSEAQSYKTVSEYFAHAQVLGATATPERTDRKQLPYDFMVRGPSTREACEQGIIMAPKVFAPERGLVPDMSGVSLARGDFAQREVAKRVKDKVLVGGIVDEYNKRAHKDKPTLVFSVDIEHSKMICAEFIAAGISARHVDGTTDSDEAAATLEDFKAGKFQVLCNCAMYMEGTDISNVSTVILARPTCSRSIFMQTCGRPMRTGKNKKTPIILDHAGNTWRHGHPVAYVAPDLDEVVPPYNRNAISKARQCKCGAMLEIGEACECGELEKPEIRTVEGELAEVREFNPQKTCRCGCEAPVPAMALQDGRVKQRRGRPWLCRPAASSAATWVKAHGEWSLERWLEHYAKTQTRTCVACGAECPGYWSQTRAKHRYCKGCGKLAANNGCSDSPDKVRLLLSFRNCRWCGVASTTDEFQNHRRKFGMSCWVCRECRDKLLVCSLERPRNEAHQ
jgi:superfamily II DNA or RNA helicase